MRPLVDGKMVGGVGGVSRYGNRVDETWVSSEGIGCFMDVRWSRMEQDRLREVMVRAG